MFITVAYSIPYYCYHYSNFPDELGRTIKTPETYFPHLDWSPRGSEYVRTFLITLRFRPSNHLISVIIYVVETAPVRQWYLMFQDNLIVPSSRGKCPNWKFRHFQDGITTLFRNVW